MREHFCIVFIHYMSINKRLTGFNSLFPQNNLKKMIFADISALTDINKSDELGIIHDSSKLTVLLKYVIITWKKNICEYISKYANISEFLDIIILTALSFVALSY